MFDLEFPSLSASLLGERSFLTPVCFNAWTTRLLLHSSSPLLHRPEPTLKSEPNLELGIMPRLRLIPRIGLVHRLVYRLGLRLVPRLGLMPRLGLVPVPVPKIELRLRQLNLASL